MLAILFVLLSCVPAHGRSSAPADCQPAAPPTDWIALPAPHPEYFRDLRPALWMARLIPSATGAMDAAMFERLGSLEKSMILYRPEVLVPVDQLEGAVCEAFCDKRREYSIIKTLVASLNGCRYCLGGVVQGLRSATHDEELIRSLIKDPGEAKLSRRERAMVEYATALTLTPRDLSRSYVENLRKAGLSDQEIFDLALMTSWFNMLTRMGPGLGYTLDPQRQLWEKQIYDKDYAAPAEGSCSGGKEWPLPAPKRQPG